MEAPIGVATAPKAPLVAVWEFVAGDQHARLGDAELGSNDVGNALQPMMHAEVWQREVARILVEHLDHAPDFGIGNAGRPSGSVRRGRQVVIGYGKMLRWPTNFSPLETKLVESEKCTALVHHVEIDIEQVLAARRAHDGVLVPYFLKDGRLGRHG